MISARMLARSDTEQYQKSVLWMANFIPTRQGTALRAPGTQFIQEVVDGVGDPILDARIFPYLSQSNERILLLMTDGNIQLLRGLGKQFGPDVQSSEAQSGTTINRVINVIENGDIRGGPSPWTLEPAEYYSHGDGPLGVSYTAGAIMFNPRLFKYQNTDYEIVKSVGQGTITEPNDVVTVRFKIDYINNPASTEGAYEIKVIVKAGLTTILTETMSDRRVGESWEYTNNVSLPTGSWTGDITVEVTVEALASATEQYSHPTMLMQYFHVYAEDPITLPLTPELATVPYGAADLADIQFVQSPYPEDPASSFDGGKEMIFCHGQHPVQRMYFNTTLGDYVFEDVVWNGGVPIAWSANNYPSCCTSYLGRLILAGGHSFEQDLGDPLSSVTETVWGTEVGVWDTFTAISPPEVNPDDSIEFTTTYRSPISWVYGHKTLLVGALEYEYIASADGIFSPGDLGVDVHSTHGSANVQPAVVGEGVLFAADGGRKCRLMRYTHEGGGWLSDDASFFVPDLLAPGIVRMVRLRNPHQMCMALLSTGFIALFHYEAGLSGWSFLSVTGGTVKDITVMANDDGIDVPYLLVERFVDDQTRLYLEAMPGWVEGQRWDYVSSGKKYRFATPTNVLTGLDHLEGQVVQVVGDDNFLGGFLVTGGQVTLENQVGEAINVTLAVAGMANPCLLITLPPDKMDPGGSLRFTDVNVRILASTMPVINNQRPAERSPSTEMSVSEPVLQFGDVQVARLGDDKYQFNSIAEDVPQNVEILGVYGKLTESSL
jgi:hypothetical protein